MCPPCMECFLNPGRSPDMTSYLAIRSPDLALLDLVYPTVIDNRLPQGEEEVLWLSC